MASAMPAYIFPGPTLSVAAAAVAAQRTKPAPSEHRQTCSFIEGILPLTPHAPLAHPPVNRILVADASPAVARRRSPGSVGLQHIVEHELALRQIACECKAPSNPTWFEAIRSCPRFAESGQASHGRCQSRLAAATRSARNRGLESVGAITMRGAGSAGATTAPPAPAGEGQR